jgi:hypothetical protein
MIAALFVQPRGSYYGLPDVELWDEKKDARTYAGPYPVIAHPPCARWSRLAGLVESRWGHKRGDDGGCFESALASVRRFGGVLEHPAFTDAFAAYGLPAPNLGGWQRTLCGGWVCYVEQGRYGHPAKKATWLYAVTPAPLPSLDWCQLSDKETRARVAWCGNRISSRADRQRVSRRIASATPEAFRDVLLTIARDCAAYGQRQAL